MRVIGYLDTKGYKTTVFKNNDRFLVKFEADLLEQTFKFRESDQIKGLPDIKLLINQSFLADVNERFVQMEESCRKRLMQFVDTQQEDTWEEII